MINSTLHSRVKKRDKTAEMSEIELRDLESASDGSDVRADAGGSRAKIRKLRGRNGRHVGPFMSSYELDEITDTTIDYIVPMPQPLPCIEHDDEFASTAWVEKEVQGESEAANGADG